MPYMNFPRRVRKHFKHVPFPSFIMLEIELVAPLNLPFLFDGADVDGLLDRVRGWANLRLREFALPKFALGESALGEFAFKSAPVLVAVRAPRGPDWSEA